MPVFSVRCVGCAQTGWVALSMDDQNEPQACDFCAEVTIRLDKPGYLSGRPTSASQSQGTPFMTNPQLHKRPNITIIDCTIVNCGTGVVMNGGHAVIDGLTVTNTPVAIELHGGATIDSRRIVHDVGQTA